MKVELWAQIEEIFHAALDLPPDERTAFIETQCAGDAKLRGEVEKLINRHEKESKFLESPVWSDRQLLKSTLKQRIALSLEREVGEAGESLNGQTIGAYRLSKELGRGGMGVVYLAERVDGFRQQVAVKIVKRGMDTDFILRRFRQERQVLAALNHANIARLLDGGTTEDGRPFLVMEYIEGLPIDRYCDVHKLSIPARLKLFREVCAAVGYSHQRLIIHRDIKPSNILVTADGTPKLLDFGIAKLLDHALASSSYRQTTGAVRMMTPDYASPEQLRGEEVTTVSDVYSLGVLLYFLLTGNLPFNFAAGQMNAFARIVSEQKPERPSRVITRSEKTTEKNNDARTRGQSLTEVAFNRATRPERLRRYLADDLDNIVLKALRKEIERRYSSVEQLSEDIERHLEGMPVKARGDAFVYKTRKFVQRHKASVLMVGLLILTLLAGIAATSWQATVASQERVRAEAESVRARRHFNDSRRLTESLMFELHDAIRDLQGATAARELLAKRTLEHLDSLASDAEGDAELQGELAIAYINLGNIQGNPYYPNLGDTNGALDSYRKAEKLTDILSSADPTNVRLRRRYWLTQIRIGDMQAAINDLPNAKQSYARASSVIEELLTQNPSDESLRSDSASGYDRQGNLLMKSGDARAALDVYDKSLKIFTRAAALHPEDDNLLRAVAAGHAKVGGAYLKTGAFDKALENYKKLLEINQSRLARNPANAVTLDDVGGSWREFGDAQMAAGDFRQAFESYLKQLQIYRQLAAADAANVKAKIELAISYERLGYWQALRNEARNGLENHEKALAILRELEAKNPADAFVANQLPAVYYYLGDANFALADGASAVSAKIRYWRAARAFFEQSKRAFSELPYAVNSLPQGVGQISDIQNRIAACEAALSAAG